MGKWRARVPPARQPEWPDFAERLRRIYGDKLARDSQKIIDDDAVTLMDAYFDSAIISSCTSRKPTALMRFSWRALTLRPTR